jgi:hypothetical protein
MGYRHSNTLELTLIHTQYHFSLCQKISSINLNLSTFHADWRSRLASLNPVLRWSKYNSVTVATVIRLIKPIELDIYWGLYCNGLKFEC